MKIVNEHTESAEGQEVSALRSAVLSGSEVPRRILLAPWGFVESTNGSFVVDEESVNLVVQAFEDHATDLPVDYEHQTLGGAYSSPTGQAPAAGWVKRLGGEAGLGLVAEIEWTEQGAELLASKEYRYLSPVAVIRKHDRKLVAIHSAALTNKPAIVGMEPIVNRLGDDSANAHGSPFDRLRRELDLAPGAAAEEILVAAGKKLARLRQDARQRQVRERVREALLAGKLVEAQRAWAEELAAREEGLFDEWFRTAPVVVTAGRSAAPGEGRGAPRRQARESRARAEFRANPTLKNLTSEEAYVADALRHAVC
jgi:phage I-like protein